MSSKQPTDARALVDCLQDGGSVARRLWAQLDRLALVQTAVQNWAGEPLARSMSVANLRDGCLFLCADSAAALTEVRYRQQELLQFLQNRFDINAIKLEVIAKRSWRSARL